MARLADVGLVQPVPYFPLVAPLPLWARQRTRTTAGVDIAHAPMFYLPRVMKSLDAGWLRRSVAGPIASMHRRRPLDAIDAHFGYPEGAGCAAIAERLHVPLFITIRGFETEFVDRPIVGRQLLAALASASGIVAVSHSLKAFAVAHGIAEAKIRVIHNAIDRELFRPSDQAGARRALGLDATAPLIVSVGNLISRKRHHVLVDAFALVRATLPTARLVIIGAKSFEPTYPDELQARVATKGLAESVVLAGNLSPHEVARWLHAADVFALATAREGCCNAVLEALGSGRPVVTTAAGDNRHFVRDGENGFLAPVDDVEALAGALSRALEVRSWDPVAISTGLGVGTWNDVGRAVLQFFCERIDAGRQRGKADDTSD
jgi:glycosyltransferase involved in cell wall biosynthesis